MALFDKLNDLANTASEKASGAIESGKTAISVNREERKIKEFTCKIGEIIVKRIDCGMEPDPEISELYKCIIAARQEIEYLKANQQCECSSRPCAEGSLYCDCCGQENPPGTRFCGNCGAKLGE